MVSKVQSKSWAPIYTYNDDSWNGFKVPQHIDWDSIDAISEHIEKYIWPVEYIFHEIISDTVHIDVHWIKPTEEKPFHTLVTSGMSGLPMTTPEWYEEYAYSELSICLPKEWKLSQEDFKDESNYWPVKWLKTLAIFPHKHNSWLSFGHTIPNGDPATPFIEGTKLTTWALHTSALFHEDYDQLKLKDKTINFYAIIALCNEEVELKLEEWIEGLYKGFRENNVTDLLDVSRNSSVKRKKFLGLF